MGFKKKSKSLDRNYFSNLRMASSSSSSSLNAFDIIVSCDKTLLKLKPAATYTYDETNNSVCQDFS